MKAVIVSLNLRNANGLCLTKIADALLERGHEVSFFTDKGCDSLLVRDYNVNIVGPKSFDQTLYLNMNRKRGTKLGSLLNLLYKGNVLIWRSAWPLDSPLFLLIFRKKLLEYVRKEKADIVISEYGNLVSLMAGSYVKKKMPCVAFFPYMLDPIAPSPSPRYLSEKSKLRKAFKWEENIFGNSTKTIVMKATKEFYLRNRHNITYFDKLEFLDIPLLLVSDNKEEKARSEFKSNEVVFLYIGSLSKGVRNPLPFIDVFERVYKDNWHLYFVGRNDYCDEIKRHEAYGKNIHLTGNVEHNVAEKMMHEADFLVNIGNEHPENMVPSKIFEYISTLKPLISEQATMKDISVEYLKKYRNSIILMRSDSIKENGDQLENFVSNSMKTEKQNKCIIDESDWWANYPMSFVEVVEKEICQGKN